MSRRLVTGVFILAVLLTAAVVGAVVNDNYTSSSATITLPPKERNLGSR